MMRQRRAGSTLIEVLFGLVILATLLASVVTARGRFLRQAGDAEQKRKLVAALDAQLDQWFAADVPTVPSDSTGALDRLPGVTWRTQTRWSDAAAALGGVVIHVEAIDGRAPPTRVNVDLLLHHVEPPKP